MKIRFPKNKLAGEQNGGTIAYNSLLSSFVNVLDEVLSETSEKFTIAMPT